MSSRKDWAAGERAELVDIGAYRVYLTASGIARKDGDPAVIVITGHSDVHIGWNAVRRAVATFARVYTYDRGGLGRSDPHTGTRTCAEIAEELSRLLESARIKPPYVVVGEYY